MYHKFNLSYKNQPLLVALGRLEEKNRLISGS